MPASYRLSKGKLFLPMNLQCSIGTRLSAERRYCRIQEHPSLTTRQIGPFIRFWQMKFTSHRERIFQSLAIITAQRCMNLATGAGIHPEWGVSSGLMDRNYMPKKNCELKLPLGCSTKN